MADDRKKNIEILIKSVLVSQGRGVYCLRDASLLYQCVSSLTTEKKEIEEANAIDALVQGALLGQKGGAYTLEDANSVFNAVKFFEKKPEKLPTITEVDENEPSSSSA